MVTDQALRGLDSLELRPDQGQPERGRLARKAWAALWPKLLAIALVLVVWELIALSGWNHLVFKGPGPVFSDLWQQMQHGMLWASIGWTMYSAAIGYAVALIIGSVVGLLVARIPPLRAAVGGIITGLQTMPSVAWAPFGIILFGESIRTILFVVILGAAPSIASGVITGVDYTPPLLLRAGKTMGLRGVALYRYLILPASLPAFVAGPEAGLGVCLAQPDGGRVVRRHRRPVLHRPAAQCRPAELGLQRSEHGDHRDSRDRHCHQRYLHEGRYGAAAPARLAGPGDDLTPSGPLGPDRVAGPASVRPVVVDAEQVARRVTQRAGLHVIVDGDWPVLA